MGCGQSRNSAEKRPKLRELDEIRITEPYVHKELMGAGLQDPDTPRENSGSHTEMATFNEGQLFVDSKFSANTDILASKDSNDHDIRFMRPCEIVSKPRLFVRGVSRSDIAQGSLGDCWFLSSCAAIAQKPELINKVLGENSNKRLYGKKYQGVLEVKFWQFGRWITVVVDDLLPVDNNGTLLYAHSTDSDNNEFWVAILEKAYAKLHGSYESLQGGQAMDALVDLTGGLAERYDFGEMDQDQISRLYFKLARAVANGAFVTCSRKGNWETDDSHADPTTGLIGGHAYTITAVRQIKSDDEKVNLIRVRNPWGRGDEWKGAWSDSDSRWDQLADSIRNNLNFKEKEDGEFWMCFPDFVTHFQEVTVCTVGPDLDGDGVVDNVGSILKIIDTWESGSTAGGCRNNIDSFATNPQFELTVNDIDDIDDSLINDEEDDEICSVIISLMQKPKRKSQRTSTNFYQIGFLIYENPEPGEQLPSDHFKYNYEHSRSGPYLNLREVCSRFEFKPGSYVIVPTTYNPDEEGKFMLRVFAPKSLSLKKLT